MFFFVLFYGCDANFHSKMTFVQRSYLTERAQSSLCLCVVALLWCLQPSEKMSRSLQTVTCNLNHFYWPGNSRIRSLDFPSVEGDGVGDCKMHVRCGLQ